jgi:hypothetical protein
VLRHTPDISHLNWFETVLSRCVFQKPTLFPRECPTTRSGGNRRASSSLTSDSRGHDNQKISPESPSRPFLLQFHSQMLHFLSETFFASSSLSACHRERPWSSRRSDCHRLRCAHASRHRPQIAATRCPDGPTLRHTAVDHLTDVHPHLLIVGSLMEGPDGHRRLPGKAPPSVPLCGLSAGFPARFVPNRFAKCCRVQSPSNGDSGPPIA